MAELHTIYFIFFCRCGSQIFLNNTLYAMIYKGEKAFDFLP